MDVEGTMEFILEQQAQFANEFVKVNEAVSSLAQNQGMMQQAKLDIANAQVRTNEILATLAERQIATEEALRGLAERQATTEETLNTLILTVEHHIANHK
jgi:hypothetical protein